MMLLKKNGRYWLPCLQWMHAGKNDNNSDNDLERSWPRSMTETQSIELDGSDGKVSNGTAVGYE